MINEEQSRRTCSKVLLIVFICRKGDQITCSLVSSALLDTVRGVVDMNMPQLKKEVSKSD